MTAPTILEHTREPRESERLATGADERFLPGWTWLAVVGLFVLFFILTPYDLLSSVSGYSLAERRGEVEAALDTVEGGSMVRRVTVLTLFLAGVIAVLVSRRESRRYHVAVITFASAFLLLALLSSAWCDEPAITIRKVIVLLILAVSAVGFARWWDLGTIARVTVVLTGMSIVVGLAAEIVLGTLHPLDPGYRFRGLSHPNGMGQLCALFLISSSVLVQELSGRRAAMMLVFGALGAVLLLLTKARGALGGATVAMAIVVITTVDRRALLVLVPALGTVVVGMLLFLPGFWADAGALFSLGRPQGGGSELLTLTGRTDLWHDLLQYSAQRPLLGYGYDSFWGPTRILEVAKSQGWIIGSSHSGYIDVLIGLGAVGLLVFLCLLASCLWTSVALRRRTGSAGSLFAIAILMWLYTNMVTEVIWFQTSIPSMVAMMVVGRLALRDTPGVVETGEGRYGQVRNGF